MSLTVSTVLLSGTRFVLFAPVRVWPDDLWPACLPEVERDEPLLDVCEDDRWEAEDLELGRVDFVLALAVVAEVVRFSDTGTAGGAGGGTLGPVAGPVGRGVKVSLGTGTDVVFGCTSASIELAIWLLYCTVVEALLGR